MSALSNALLEEMGEELVTRLADALASRVAPLFASAGSPWLDADEAAAHLRIGKSSLYRMQRLGVIPAYQDGPGARLFFHRDELDDYRRSNPA